MLVLPLAEIEKATPRIRAGFEEKIVLLRILRVLIQSPSQLGTRKEAAQT